MNFNSDYTELPYTRIEFDRILEQILTLRHSFVEAGAKKQISLIAKVEAQRTEFMHALVLVRFRAMANAKDSYYQKEEAYINTCFSRYADCVKAFYDEILASDHLKAIEKYYGEVFVRNIRLAGIPYQEAIKAEREKNVEHTLRHRKLLAKAEVEFDGAKYNLAQLEAHTRSSDRALREKAFMAHSDWYYEHKDKLHSLYVAMVKNRRKMAQKAGYRNYYSMSLDVMKRVDYGDTELKGFQHLVTHTLAPQLNQRFEARRERLNYDRLEHWDLMHYFENGNAQMLGDTSFLLQQMEQMCERLSPEAGNFFRSMRARKLMDLETRPGKSSGGFCTYDPKIRMPLIFTNFTGVSDDYRVLSHEMGHAFQYFLGREVTTSEARSCSAEIAEVHSIGFELLLYPHLDLVFGADAKKYEYQHLTESLKLVCHATSVDAFQRMANIQEDWYDEDYRMYFYGCRRLMTPWERNASHPYQRSGWHYQQTPHIFQYPFYYVDYALATMVSLQLWAIAQKDPQRAWTQYMKLCELGGQHPFLKTLRLVGLQSPFDEDVFRTTIENVCAHLEHLETQVYPLNLGSIRA